ncbi:MAG: cytochrome C [Deltaproteobacteria bacterium]|nr:cytochrome C [Deltaproteobacteria bacterium]
MSETQKVSASDNKRRDAGGTTILFFLIGVAISLALGWIIFPKLIYSKKSQPIDFSHVVHNEAVGDCDSCHFFREDGTFSGSPTLAECIDCHEEAQGDAEDERIFVEEYVAQNKEVPWLIYSEQPDCVFFSHAAHVKKAEMSCESCHGKIGTSETLPIYEENRITGYSRNIWGKDIAGIKKHTWDRMKMDDCGECHEEETGDKGSCFQCHK